MAGRFIRRAAPLVVVVAVALAMVWSAVFGLKATASERSASNVTFWEVEAAYYSCLARQVQTVVPHTDIVWVSYATPNAPFWYRTLWKVAAAYTFVTPNPKNVVDLYLVSAPQNQGCLGAHVRAVFPSGSVRYGVGSTPKVDWSRWKSLGGPSLP